MAAVNELKFKEYITASEGFDTLQSEYLELFREITKGKDTWEEVQSGRIDNHEQLKKFDLRLKDRLENECVISYVNDLSGHKDVPAEYFNDIINATKNGELYLVRVLMRVTEHLPLLNPAIDIFLLNYFCDLFQQENDKKKVGLAAILFERVLDTSDNDLDEYVTVINKIFDINKGKEYYNDFYRSAEKLISRAPVKREAFFAIKKGLVNTTNDMRILIEKYLEANYVHMGLADTGFNWISK